MSKPIPPRNETYEFIIFRGSDIKDLNVIDVPSQSSEPEDPAPQDPAILSAVSQCSLCGQKILFLQCTCITSVVFSSKSAIFGQLGVVVLYGFRMCAQLCPACIYCYELPILAIDILGSPFGRLFFPSFCTLCFRNIR